MTDLMKLLLVPVLASALLLTGCGGEDTPDEREQHSENDGHNHVSEGEDEHESEHKLGEIKIAQTVLEVAVGGEPEPNATLHLDLKHKSGPMPATIRVWVGDKSASGSIKGKASGSHGEYHADAMCPAELEEAAALWIELESADGTRTAGSLSLEHHDEQGHDTHMKVTTTIDLRG